MKSKEAWMLGFMYADGCITDNNSIIINIATKDIDTLEKLKVLISKDVNIKTRQSGIYFSSRIEIRSKELANYFKDLGCIPRKSLVLTFPNINQVPVELQSHFIRGYFDGDGSICYRESRNEAKINFKGTELFLNELRNILLNIGCTCSIYKQNNSKIWNLDITGYNNIIMFLEFMYKESQEDIRMDRKYNKALNIFITIEKLRKKKNKFNKILSI